MGDRPHVGAGRAQGSAFADDGGAKFHVEQQTVREWAKRNGIALPVGATDRLVRYAALVIEANRRHNLTGCATIEEAVERLVLASLEPLRRLDVPRGTRFADIGSGAGVPGIPLALVLAGAAGVLMEAQAKRAAFIECALKELALSTLSVVCGRIENLACLAEYRGAFDVVFSRAFGPVYVVLEMALPLLRTGGYLYIYSKLRGGDLERGIIEHAVALGGCVDLERADAGGVVVNKTAETPGAYPRRYAVIRRAAGRIGGDGEHET